ncbi:MAG: hypothetical protein ACI3XQ_08390 [Eubacteriales bacterium]
MKQLKQVLSVFLAIVIMIPAASFTGSAEGAVSAVWPDYEKEGEVYTPAGTEEDPILISDASELLAFASQIGGETLAGKYVKLTADIDLNPGWDASSSAPEVTWPWKYDSFTGVFDGDGYTISGIYLEKNDKDYVGIFGGFLGANKSLEIKNLSIVNSYICGGTSNGYVGTLIGITSGGGTQTVLKCSNIYADTIVSSTKMRTGGMVGYVQKGITLTFENCVFAGSVSNSVSGSDANIGGFAGRIEPSNTSTIRFNACAFYGTVRAEAATQYIGGFVGVITNAFEENDIIFENCIAAGNIYGPEGTKNCGIYCKVSNDSAVLVMKNCLYTDSFYIDETVQNWNTPFNASNKTKIDNTKEVIYDELLGLSALSLSCIDLSQWKASPNNSFPLPKDIYYMVYDQASDENLSATPITKLVGYQLSVPKDGNFSTRLVAVLTDDALDSYQNLGFKVTIKYGNEAKSCTRECTTVYSSLIGKDKDDTEIVYDAKSLGGAYIFALNINNIPVDLGEITFHVTTFHVTDGADAQPVDDYTSVITINTSMFN